MERSLDASTECSMAGPLVCHTVGRWGRSTAFYLAETMVSREAAYWDSVLVEMWVVRKVSYMVAWSAFDVVETMAVLWEKRWAVKLDWWGCWKGPSWGWKG